MPKLVVIGNEVEADARPLEWRERTLVVKHQSGRVDAVHGWQYGTLTVHRTLFVGVGLPAFTVTHHPSKVAVARLDDSDEAVAQAEWLWHSCPQAWSGDDVDKSRITGEVMRWLKEHQ